MSTRFLLRARNGIAPVTFFLSGVGTYVLGRQTSCDLVVQDATVSRFHAQIEANHVRIRILDLESSNGTFLDERRITDACARPGQRVRFGQLTFDLIDGLASCSGAPDPLPTPPVPVRTNPTLHVRLTPKQQAVLDQLLQGLTEKEIAERLAKSPHTVHHQVTAIYRAFGVTSYRELLTMLASPGAPTVSSESPEKRPKWPE